MRDSCRRLMSWKLAGVLIVGMVAAFVIGVMTPATGWAASGGDGGSAGGDGGAGGTSGSANVTIKKQIYICDAATSSPTNFDCEVEYENANQNTMRIPVGPDSGRYVICSGANGCLATASDFGAGIFRDAVAIPELSSAGVTTDLSDFHYVVTENERDDVWDRNDDCAAAGFRHGVSITRLQDNGQKLINYSACADYSDDCTGTLQDNETKTCTVKNYIWDGRVETNDN